MNPKLLPEIGKDMYYRVDNMRHLIADYEFDVLNG